MAKNLVHVTDQLRDLIKVTRTSKSPRLTQRGAGRLAGYSAVWWRHIESGAQPNAQSDTLARMCYVIGVSPGQLDAIGYPEVASDVRKRQDMLSGDPLNPYRDNEAEAYLWDMPGADTGTRRALIAHLRVLRDVGGDPISADVVRHMRSRE